MKPATAEITGLPSDMTACAPRGGSRTADTSSIARTPSRLTDLYELTKPRMNFLVVLTTMVGFSMASRFGIDWMLMFHTVLGTALTAAGAAVLNQVIERRQDAQMPRTAGRAVAAGRMSPARATWMGIAYAIAGVSYLALAVNSLTAMLGLATILLYLLVYTPLKQITSLNTVIGAIPGAIPPLMGFTAVNNRFTTEAWIVFGILFVWQMPHFLAIAILYKRDYIAGGFKMLPCIEDDAMPITRRMIVLYSAVLLPVTLLPAVIGMAGPVFFTAAVLLGLAFFSCAVACAASRRRSDARQLFFASIIYLPLLLGLMIFDKM